MRESGGHAVDPLADTVRIDLFADTQPMLVPSTRASFEPDEDRWFDEGERNAEEEWAELAQRTFSCPSLSLALAFAGSAALGILIAVAL